MELNFSTVLQVVLLIGLLVLLFRRGGCCGGNTHSRHARSTPTYQEHLPKSDSIQKPTKPSEYKSKASCCH